MSNWHVCLEHVVSEAHIAAVKKMAADNRTQEAIDACEPLYKLWASHNAEEAGHASQARLEMFRALVESGKRVQVMDAVLAKEAEDAKAEADVRGMQTVNVATSIAMAVAAAATTAAPMAGRPVGRGAGGRSVGSVDAKKRSHGASAANVASVWNASAGMPAPSVARGRGRGRSPSVPRGKSSSRSPAVSAKPAKATIKSSKRSSTLSRPNRSDKMCCS